MKSLPRIWLTVFVMSWQLLNTAGATDQPHILLIVADDLGWGDVGYQGGRIETPHIDRLAEEGVRLSHFYAMPLCSPTRGAIMTGKHPIRLGLQAGVIRPWATHGLPLDEVILPERLRQVGYLTAMIGKWHLGHHSAEYLPTARGFDYHYGHYNGAIDYFQHERDGGHDWHRGREPVFEEGYATDLLADDAVRLIREHDPSVPLFLYLPFNSPHTPLQAPDSWLEQYSHYQLAKRRTYAAMVSNLDAAIGRVVGEADQRLNAENTFVFFCSDNGGIPGPGSNGELRGGKGTLYEGGVRVPAIARWKGTLEAGETRADPLHVVDLFPTFLQVGQQEISDPIDGRDFLPALKGETSFVRETLLLNATPASGALRKGPWKIVQTGEDWELFNLNHDPGEKRNLARQHPRIFQRLKTNLEEARSEAVEPLRAGRKPKDFVVPRIWGSSTPTTNRSSHEETP